MKVKMM